MGVLLHFLNIFIGLAFNDDLNCKLFPTFFYSAVFLCVFLISLFLLEGQKKIVRLCTQKVIKFIQKSFYRYSTLIIMLSFKFLDIFKMCFYLIKTYFLPPFYQYVSSLRNNRVPNPLDPFYEQNKDENVHRYAVRGKRYKERERDRERGRERERCY